MGKYKVYISEPAEQDLKAIVQYINSHLCAPTSAMAMIELFEEKMISLEDMPQRYSLVTDERLSLLGYRKIVVNKYLIFFSVDEANKVVDVERILYGRRDWMRII